MGSILKFMRGYSGKLDALISIELFCVLLLLIPLAVFFPLQLYVIAIAVFGLPHVIWEMSWVKQLYGRTIKPTWWAAIGAVLMLQIIARASSWASLTDAYVVQILDILTLGLLFILSSLIIITFRITPRNIHISFGILVIGLGLIYSVQGQNILAILVCLGIAHNFTPILLARGTNNQQVEKYKQVILYLFMLPFFLFSILVITGIGENSASATISNWVPQEAKWLGAHLPRFYGAVLSSLVLAQCLHYYVVIRLIPASLGESFKVLPNAFVGIAISFLMVVFFVFNFTSAKGFYAIAAGAHAWLEWALIALIMGSYKQCSSQKHP